MSSFLPISKFPLPRQPQRRDNAQKRSVFDKKARVKYFFLSQGWTVGRVWEFGGLWNENAWRRKPQIEQINVGIVEQDQTLLLYQVEDAVLMLEVIPTRQASNSPATIGQVVLKRLITAEQVIERLKSAEGILSHFEKTPQD